jgi:hypothetical protein
LAASTAAAAVVFEPLAVHHDRDAHRAEERCPRTLFEQPLTPSSTRLPPIKIAVCFKSAGPRVKIAPCTSGSTFSQRDPAVTE